jgi:tetraacyldisaccharide 4'-kinase
VIGALRELVYRNGLIRPVELPALTVSVGNLSLGGTGKSPFVMALCEWALSRKISCAVLSRGYKREKKGLEIVGPGISPPEVSRLGDEPWMIKCRLPGISLLVHPDRARMAARHWEELGGPRLVLLDDGFQHWRAARDRDVVMLDAGESLRQPLLPFGRLRERGEALARADLVVITRAASVPAEELARLERQVRALAAAPVQPVWKRSRASELKVAAADYEFRHFFDLETGKECTFPPEAAAVLVSGVAKPEGVRALAASQGLEVREEIIFPDHHRLRAGDLARVRAALGAKVGTVLLVTEKDWARWRTSLQGLPGCGMRVGFRFLGEGERMVREFCEDLERCSISR